MNIASTNSLVPQIRYNEEIFTRSPLVLGDAVIILVRVGILRSDEFLFCCRSGILPRRAPNRGRMPLLQK